MTETPRLYAEDVSGLRCRIIDDPEAGTPLVVPARRASLLA